MRRLLMALVPLSILAAYVDCINGADRRLPPHVLYIGAPRTFSDRRGEFEEVRRAHFTRVSVVERDRFKVSDAKDADVVIFDWAQGTAPNEKVPTPFGPLEDWSKPTVLIDSAGLLLAERWHLIGAAG